MIIALILLTVWISFYDTIEDAIVDHMMICILSCVVGAFMARRIPPSIHLPTLLLLLNISCSVGYTFVSALDNVKNLKGISYVEYGTCLMDLLGLFGTFILLTSSLILVIKTMLLYR